MGDGGSSLGMGANGWWFTIALVVLVVARFLARELRVRKVPLNRFFLLPAIFCLLSGWLIFVAASTAPQLGAELAIGCAAALVVGIATGFALDRYTTLSLSGDGKIALIRGSRATVAIWVAVLLLRMLGRSIVVHAIGTVTLGMTMTLNAALIVIVAAAAVVLRILLFGRIKAMNAAQRSTAPA